jgi:hypothetical protein
VIAGRIPNVDSAGMTRLVLVATLVAAAACQSSSGSPPPAPAPKTGPAIPQPFVTDGYRSDITSICDVMKLSGADKEAPDARQAIIAMWLGPHITTDEGHKFLIAIQPLQGVAKANALESEGRRVGLADCPLAGEWRGSAAVNPL